jgi:WD40 repeat protein
MANSSAVFDSFLALCTAIGGAKIGCKLASRCGGVAFSSDSKRVISSGSKDYLLFRVWDAESGDEILNPTYSPPMRSAAGLF